MMRGRFITLEGTEGGGKSTNARLVRELLESHGITVVQTREPGGTVISEAVRELILKVRKESFDPLAELLLVFGARAQHIAEVIEPALARGDWVLCERFTDATYAYQGAGRGIPAAQIEVLEQLVQDGLQPDLTLYLDVPVAVALERIKNRRLDRFEREQEVFFERIRNCYLARAKRFRRFSTIDAARPLKQVQKDITRRVEAFLVQTGYRSYKDKTNPSKPMRRTTQ